MSTLDQIAENKPRPNVHSDTFRSNTGEIINVRTSVQSPPQQQVMMMVPAPAPCTPTSKPCWSRKSLGMILMMIFNLLMIIVVVILLFVVDLQTNQIADTAMLALVFLFTGVIWFMSCECGATAIPGSSSCANPPSCDSF